MKVSASSFETVHASCTRKWWWKEERDMPEGKVIAGSDFGTAIHAVNERWRKADDRGNGPELYPPGWNAGLDAADSALVKLLHEKAVETGILVRRAGRKPEEWMDRPIIIDDDVVRLTGKLDCEDEEGFEDDKSTKAAKWAKDEQGLASDSAMLFYAVEWCQRHADAIRCRMRYNYFLKDPSHPKTWPVEALVAREVVEHFKQNELLPTIRKMVAVSKQKLTDDQWEQVEGPKTQDACRAFGGCPYATICGRVEQPAQYRARIARVLANRVPQPAEPTMGVFPKAGTAPASPVPASPSPAPLPAATPPTAPAAAPAVAAPPAGGIFARRNSTPSAAPASTSTAAQPVTPATAVQSTPPAPAVAVQAPPAPTAAPSAAAPAAPVQAAPWAHPGCRSCKGTGMHPTEKRPCKGCRTARLVQKLPTDESYDITYAADGSMQWKLKDGVQVPAAPAAPTQAAGSMPAIAPVATPTQAPTPTITEPVKTEKAPPRSRKKADVAADVAPTPPTTQQEANLDQVTASIQDEAAARGLPLIILTGAFPEKLPAYYRAVSMADVFSQVTAEIGEGLKKSYWDINAFERRDLLAKFAPKIAEQLKATVLVCSRSTPDVDSLVQALKPFAGMVLAGLN